MFLCCEKREAGSSTALFGDWVEEESAQERAISEGDGGGSALETTRGDHRAALCRVAAWAQAIPAGVDAEDLLSPTMVQHEQSGG